jgi:hypothetical protein
MIKVNLTVPVKQFQAQQRQQAGQLVSMLAENDGDDVVFVGGQQRAHDLRRADDRAEYQVGLGSFHKLPRPTSKPSGGPARRPPTQRG